MTCKSKRMRNGRGREEQGYRWKGWNEVEWGGSNEELRKILLEGRGAKNVGSRLGRMEAH
jgi:hypothetical protein